MEAVKLVESSQSIAEAWRSLGVVEQTLANWVKLGRAGKLKEVVGKTLPDLPTFETLRCSLEYRPPTRRSSAACLRRLRALIFRRWRPVTLSLCPGNNFA